MNCRVIGVDAIANHEPVLIEVCFDACSGLCVVECIHLQTIFGSTSSTNVHCTKDCGQTHDCSLLCMHTQTELWLHRSNFN